MLMATNFQKKKPPLLQTPKRLFCTTIISRNQDFSFMKKSEYTPIQQ